jgi:hypothetical protein
MATKIFRSGKRQLDSALCTGMPWVAGRGASSHGRGRWFNPSRAHHKINHLGKKQTEISCAGEQTLRLKALLLVAGLALAFDPHVLLLSWSAGRQELVAATSAATCRAAIDAIGAGRWLADDPPTVARCERGSAFAPGSGCITGYNCQPR